MVLRASVSHGPAVRVPDARIADVVDLTVIEEPSVLPIAALVARAGVAVAVVDAAVEADMRPPIAGVPEIGAVAPTPPRRRPIEPDRGRKHPGARHPVVVILAVGPVAGCPDVAVAGDRRLLIDGQRRRRDPDGD